ncbi:hypothetical protein ACRAWF_09790 [Streptomyces sp. L7]
MCRSTWWRHSWSRALHSDDPAGADSGDVTRDLLTAGINTVRGSAAESLGNLLAHDTDRIPRRPGRPPPAPAGGGPLLDVRACVALLLRAAIRHDRPAVADAFETLVQAPDQLLASPYVPRLAVALMHGDPASAGPLTRRMLRSPLAPVSPGRRADRRARRHGVGDLAPAGTGAGRARHGPAAGSRRRVRPAPGEHRRRGTRPPRTRPVLPRPRRGRAEAAAAVAAALRGRRLGPHRRTLIALIDSQAFGPALTQLLITFEDAPDRVDELVLTCVQRFVTVFGAASADPGPRRRGRRPSHRSSAGPRLRPGHVGRAPVRRSSICWTGCCSSGPTAWPRRSTTPTGDDRDGPFPVPARRSCGRCSGRALPRAPECVRSTGGPDGNVHDCGDGVLC